MHLARTYWGIPSSSFEIGGNTTLPRRLRLRTSEILPQPLRIRRIFSNTSSPCLCHSSNVRIFIYYNITMAMAEACLGGIGKYPPYPSRLCNTPLVRRLRLRTSGDIGNLSGCGGYFPIPPCQASANVPL